MTMPVGFHDYFTMGGLFLGQAIPTIPPTTTARGRYAGGSKYWYLHHERPRSIRRRLRPMATQMVLADAVTTAIGRDYENRKAMVSRAMFSALMAEA
jgi:hypothetical protein